MNIRVFGNNTIRDINGTYQTVVINHHFLDVLNQLGHFVLVGFSECLVQLLFIIGWMKNGLEIVTPGGNVLTDSIKRRVANWKLRITDDYAVPTPLHNLREFGRSEWNQLGVDAHITKIALYRRTSGSMSGFLRGVCKGGFEPVRVAGSRQQLLCLLGM